MRAIQPSNESHSLRENIMRYAPTVVLSFSLFALLTAPLSGEDYLTKEGRLTQPLKIVQLQGGFAGYTGMQFTVDPDGTWATASLFNDKKTPNGSGKLTEKDVAKLAAILKTYDLAKLPAKSGVQPGANPHGVCPIGPCMSAQPTLGRAVTRFARYPLVGMSDGRADGLQG